MEFSITDTLRQSVEIMSGGKNTVMYDDQGNPNIMVCVPKYDASALGLKAGTHPAFIIDDDHNEVNEIWVGKYHASKGENGGSMVWHETYPYGHVNSLEEAKQIMAKKGKGWHLMSNLEWSAVALLAWKNGHSHPAMGTYLGEPGRYISHRSETGAIKGDSEVDGFMMDCTDVTQSTDGAVTGIFNFPGYCRDIIDGIYEGYQEVIYYWCDKDKNPINCFQNERYGSNEFVFDVGKTGSPTYNGSYINRGDRSREFGNQHSEPYWRMGSYHASNHMTDEFDNMCRLLGLLPIPGMTGENVKGRITWRKVDDENAKLTLLRGVDMWYCRTGTAYEQVGEGNDMFESHFVNWATLEHPYPQYSMRPVYISTK